MSSLLKCLRCFPHLILPHCIATPTPHHKTQHDDRQNNLASLRPAPPVRVDGYLSNDVAGAAIFATGRTDKAYLTSSKMSSNATATIKKLVQDMVVVLEGADLQQQQLRLLKGIMVRGDCGFWVGVREPGLVLISCI